MKFAALAHLFLQTRQQLVLTHELAPSSYRADEIRFERMKTHFGERLVVEITTSEVEEFLESLTLARKSAATRNRYRAALYTFFKYAAKRLGIAKNPVTDTRSLPEKVKTRQLDFWHSEAERDRYLIASEHHGSVFGVGAAILCLGGCRISELLALQWSDIEWESDIVRIRKIVERGTNRVEHRTKGQRAGGEYPMVMVPRLKRRLEAWLLSSRWSSPADFVVAQPSSGKHFSYDQWARVHERVILHAGVKRITLHDIRRTFATHAKRSGFHKAEISDLLGHETQSTVDAYLGDDISHLIEKAKKVGFGK